MKWAEVAETQEKIPGEHLPVKSSAAASTRRVRTALAARVLIWVSAPRCWLASLAATLLPVEVEGDRSSRKWKAPSWCARWD